MAPRIVYAAREEPPFAVDALVEEEDTYLSMSAAMSLTIPDAHPIRVLTEARDATETEPGTVVVRPGNPLKFLAVVHRLSETPTWREEWVSEAFRSLRREVVEEHVRLLGLPLLGTVHGGMSPTRSFELMSGILLGEPELERVWVITR